MKRTVCEETFRNRVFSVNKLDFIRPCPITMIIMPQ